MELWLLDDRRRGDLCALLCSAQAVDSILAWRLTNELPTLGKIQDDLFHWEVDHE